MGPGPKADAAGGRGHSGNTVPTYSEVEYVTSKAPYSHVPAHAGLPISILVRIPNRAHMNRSNKAPYTTPIHNKCTIGGGQVFISKLKNVKRRLQNRYTQKKMLLSCTPGHALPSSNIFL